ncbi:hypothetical protein F4810DRAFT_686267 [Camillea tinctor]|nr:hypothetical protein F4810DRAFT_686267 [Camillea tinctor]
MACNGDSSSNSGMSKSLFDRIPNEIMLEVVSELYEQTDLINLAISQPSRFISPSFNIFEQDAASQAKLQAGRSYPVMEECVDFQDYLPLLNIAIEKEYSPEVIRSILEAYQKEYPDTINGIWGSTLRAIPPPLHCAIEARRPEIVSLLLDLGANPYIKYNSPWMNWKDEAEDKCDNEGLAHMDCISNGVVIPSANTTCDNSLEAAIRWGGHYSVFGSVEHNERVAISRNCARELYYRVPSLQAGMNAKWIINAFRSGIEDLVEDRLETLAARDDNDKEKQDFKTTCSTFLAELANSRWSNRDFISYVADIGAPNYLIDTISTHRTRYNGEPHNYAIETCRGGAMENATGLLEAMARRGVKLDAEPLKPCATSDAFLCFTDVYIQMLKDGVFPDCPKDKVPEFMSDMLLLAIDGMAHGTLQMLIDEGCPVSLKHVEEATKNDWNRFGRRGMEDVLRSKLRN